MQLRRPLDSTPDPTELPAACVTRPRGPVRRHTSAAEVPLEAGGGELSGEARRDSGSMPSASPSDDFHSHAAASVSGSGGTDDAVARASRLPAGDEHGGRGLAAAGVEATRSPRAPGRLGPTSKDVVLGLLEVGGGAQTCCSPEAPRGVALGPGEGAAAAGGQLVPAASLGADGLDACLRRLERLRWRCLGGSGLCPGLSQTSSKASI